MTDQDAKEKSFYNVIINPDVESQNQNLNLGSTSETRQNLPFVRAQRVQDGRQITTQHNL